MNYDEAIAYIHSVSWRGSRPGLSRTLELAEKMGNPQDSLKFIHVTGTNGKGSFCKMTDSILRAAGYKTGLYISPFIKTFNERMSVDGADITDEELAAITETVKSCVETMEDHPTEFEIVTVIAFEYFKRNKCDFVVLEVGMGGRLDSTNIIKDPILSVITGIDFDHTAYLGDTIEKIAYEKAGIVKAGYPVLYGGKKRGGDDIDGALTVISEIAAERGSPFYATDHSAVSNVKCSLDGSTFDFGEFKDVHIPLLALYQVENAATVLTAARILSKVISLPDDAIYRGLSNVEWSGRFELLCKDPIIISDGSHNPQGIKVTAESIRFYFKHTKVNIITGTMADKNYHEMIETLRDITEFAYTISSGDPRALGAKEYAEAMAEHGIPSAPYDRISDAVIAASADSKKKGIPLIALGTLHMYAEVKKTVNELK
jgi:folylpolyglutamate synthase/dihydrofolate synthase